jgi:N-acetylmuramoyl-L-alanine amidase
MGAPTTSDSGTTRRAHRSRGSAVFKLLVVLVLLAVAALVARYLFDIRPTSASSASSPTAPGSVALDPTLFANGSCIAFPPTSGDREETVFLDAGHGGIDPGGVGTTESGKTIYEADETLPVELDVMALLRAKGFRVVVSRTGDSTVLRLGAGDTDQGQLLTLQGAHDDVVARDQCANDAKANILVGIYYDAGGSAQNAGSITAYDPDRPFSAANLQLANLVQTDVLNDLNAQGWGIPNDGVQTDGQLGSLDGDPASGGLAAEAAAYNHLLLIGPAMPGYFTTPSLMPGVVIEPLYITDPFEGTIADSVKGQQTIAQGIATAVEQYLAPPPSKASKANH